MSPDLAERFRAEVGPVVVVGDAPRLDLWASNRLVLEAAGVPSERITGDCWRNTERIVPGTIRFQFKSPPP